MGKIIAGIKVIDGKAEVQMSMEKATVSEYGMAIGNLELMKEKLLKQFEKLLIKSDKKV